jgi:hypothetical protein
MKVVGGMKWRIICGIRWRWINGVCGIMII